MTHLLLLLLSLFFTTQTTQSVKIHGNLVILNPPVIASVPYTNDKTTSNISATENLLLLKRKTTKDKLWFIQKSNNKATDEALMKECHPEIWINHTTFVGFCKHPFYNLHAHYEAKFKFDPRHFTYGNKSMVFVVKFKSKTTVYPSNVIRCSTTKAKKNPVFVDTCHIRFHNLSELSDFATQEHVLWIDKKLKVKTIRNLEPMDYRTLYSKRFLQYQDGFEAHRALLANWNLSGAGITVTVVDTGLDPLHAMFYDPLHWNDVVEEPLYTIPLPNSGHTKIRAIVSVFPGLYGGTYEAHGTSTSGVAVGYEALDEIGIASSSLVMFVKIANDVDEYLYLPSDMTNALDYCVSTGDSSVSSNSYGECDGQGQYTYLDAQFDQAVENNPELVNVIAAGNYDPPYCSSTTIGSPAVSKNSISVGASFSNPADYSSIITDTNFLPLMNYLSVNSFSCTGPLADGRIAPILYAPGFECVVAVGFIPNDYPDQDTFYRASGTSFSTPAIAGLAAIFQSWWNQTHGHIPIFPLTKATLISLALNRKPTRVIDAFTLSITQNGGFFGYGTPFIDTLSGYFYFNSSIGNGMRFSLLLTGASLCTLSWADKAAAPGAIPSLIDNLDLFVIDTLTGMRLTPQDNINPDEFFNNNMVTVGHPLYVVIIGHISESSRAYGFFSDAANVSFPGVTCLPGEYITCQNGIRLCNYTSQSYTSTCYPTTCPGNTGGGISCNIEVDLLSPCYMAVGKAFTANTTKTCTVVSCNPPMVLGTQNYCSCPPLTSNTVSESGTIFNCVNDIYPGEEIAMTSNGFSIHSSEKRCLLETLISRLLSTFSFTISSFFVLVVL